MDSKTAHKKPAVSPPQKHSDNMWAKKIEIAKTARSQAIRARRSSRPNDARSIVAGLLGTELKHEH